MNVGFNRFNLLSVMLLESLSCILYELVYVMFCIEFLILTCHSHLTRSQNLKKNLLVKIVLLVNRLIFAH